LFSAAPFSFSEIIEEFVSFPGKVVDAASRDAGIGNNSVAFFDFEETGFSAEVDMAVEFVVGESLKVGEVVSFGYATGFPAVGVLFGVLKDVSDEAHVAFQRIDSIIGPYAS